MSIIIRILWNLLCKYNNINISLHQYLKRNKKKKKTQTDTEKKTHEVKVPLQLQCIQCQQSERTVLKYCTGKAAFIIKRFG